jgi:hypothetical protein
MEALRALFAKGVVERREAVEEELGFPLVLLKAAVILCFSTRFEIS